MPQVPSQEWSHLHKDTLRQSFPQTDHGLHWQGTRLKTGRLITMLQRGNWGTRVMKGSCGAADNYIRHCSSFLPQIQALGATHPPKICNRSVSYSHTYFWSCDGSSCGGVRHCSSMVCNQFLKEKNNIIGTKYLTVKRIIFAPDFINASKDLLPIGINPKQSAPRLLWL